MDLKLTGQTALVTGASQGIGEVVAKSLAEEGVNLHLTARNMNNLEQVKQDIEESFDVRVELHSFDLTERGA